MKVIFLLNMPGDAMWMFIILMGIIPFLCIIDVMRSDFRYSNVKPIWCALIVFLPLIGPLLYWWIGTEQKAISRG